MYSCLLRQPKRPLNKLFSDFPLGLVLKIVVLALDKNCLKVPVAISATVKLHLPAFQWTNPGPHNRFSFCFLPFFLPFLSFSLLTLHFYGCASSLFSSYCQWGYYCSSYCSIFSKFQNSVLFFWTFHTEFQNHVLLLNHLQRCT